MESVLLAKAEQGDFVLQLLAPVAKEGNVQKTLSDGLNSEDPYEHRVVPMLQSGLEALNKAAKQNQRDRDLSLFKEAVYKD